MISVNRVLSFDEYFEASKLVLRNGNSTRRLNYLLCRWVLPLVGALAQPILISKAVHYWQAAGDNGLAFGAICGLSFLGLWMLFGPILFRRRARKLFEQQELHREWRLEITDEGVHSALPGLSDSKLEWPFFDKFIETEDLFIIHRAVRSVFVSVPKRFLTKEEQQELRSILKNHLCAQ